MMKKTITIVIAIALSGCGEIFDKPVSLEIISPVEREDRTPLQLSELKHYVIAVSGKNGEFVEIKTVPAHMSDVELTREEVMSKIDVEPGEYFDVIVKVIDVYNMSSEWSKPVSRSFGIEEGIVTVEVGGKKWVIKLNVSSN